MSFVMQLYLCVKFWPLTGITTMVYTVVRKACVIWNSMLGPQWLLGTGVHADFSRSGGRN